MAKNATLEARAKRTHPWAFPLGLGIAALAIVGVITLMTLGVQGIKYLTDKTPQKNAYAAFLQSVVRNDPSPFDDISKANMPQLLDAAIWNLIGTGASAFEKYEYSDSDPIGYIVPLEDVEASFVRLFGSEIKPLHATVLGAGYTFYYDAVTQEYTIPITGISPIYVPKVYEIEKKGSSIFLSVGFVGYNDWAVDKMGRQIEPKPVKVMKITLRERKTDDKNIPSYYIAALQAADADEIAVSTAKKSKQTMPETTLPVETTQVTETPETTEEPQTDESGAVLQTDVVPESTD